MINLLFKELTRTFAKWHEGIEVPPYFENLASYKNYLDTKGLDEYGKGFLARAYVALMEGEDLSPCGTVSEGGDVEKD